MGSRKNLKRFVDGLSLPAEQGEFYKVGVDRISDAGLNEIESLIHEANRQMSEALDLISKKMSGTDRSSIVKPKSPRKSGTVKEKVVIGRYRIRWSKKEKPTVNVIVGQSLLVNNKSHNLELKDIKILGWSKGARAHKKKIARAHTDSLITGMLYRGQLKDLNLLASRQLRREAIDHIKRKIEEKHLSPQTWVRVFVQEGGRMYRAESSPASRREGYTNTVPKLEEYEVTKRG